MMEAIGSEYEVAPWSTSGLIMIYCNDVIGIPSYLLDIHRLDDDDLVLARADLAAQRTLPASEQRQVDLLLTRAEDALRDRAHKRLREHHWALMAAMEERPPANQGPLAHEVVALAPHVAASLRADGRTGELWTHAGYKRLAIDAERAKDYSGAIRLCKQAKREGWAGDWDKRIERCQAKAAKTQPKPA
jgi:hypothetical protein